MAAEVGESSTGGAKPAVRESQREKLTKYSAGKLAERTLEGKWNKVVEMYTKYPGAQTHRIAEDNDNTALHVAVDLKKEQAVKELVEAIIKFERAGDEEALRVQNKNGDTPLHLAASRGFTKICMYIIGEREERMHLLRLENKKGETPFFLAALNWNAHALAYLSSVADNLLWNSNELADDTRRLVTRGTGKDINQRESILHCAINRECFDLAFIIARNYSFLTMHAHNGITPLHVLAKRPSAFKSTTKLSFLKQMLYHIMPVGKLDVDKEMEKYRKEIQRLQLSNGSKKIGEKKARRSWLLGKLLRNLPGQRHEYDEENASKCFGKCGAGFLPPNYDTFLQFLKSVYVHSSLIRLVDAFSEVRGTKQKHVWSDQLLCKLMENPFEAFTGMAGEEPTHGPDELSFFDPDEDIFKDIVGRNIENSPKPENPSDTRGGAPTDQNDSKEGTKSGDLVLKCCDCVISNVKNTEDCERMKPMRPQLLMKCGCGRADCKSNIAAAIAVADHSTEDASDDDSKKETPYLLAAKHGIIEMVTMIQQKIPSVIHTTNSKNQNVLLVAVKNRQPQVVLELKKKSEAEVWDNLVIGVDDDDNTLLHLAAHGLKGDKSWQIAGSALQMMWDIKWYQYMKKIVPRHCHFRSNKDSKTAGQIFNTSHQELIQEASQWLKDTSESCSVVAALVAGVSFATAGNVPGGYDNGEPPLEGQPAFEVFALASLVGLCFSVTGLIMFLSILTSRKVAKDFRRSLPLKLLAGLSSLFVSIITMFVSFCSGHFFLVNHKYKSILFPLYAATSIPVAFYALAQFPLYFDLLRAILTTVPTASDVGEIL
ncbi:hypothetical protein HN51_049753 [Arachis hypogaea]|uniref:uncharacterized protein LOC107608929 isoform X1 n=1 Tax=Arachis ipaensis TaxID=130454 RepID=UPI000A2AF2FF|nr:uncharacterized protein LOC107608929 isoform X1 [Arachis ipaensis]